MTATRATDVLPTESDLPGAGWVAIDEGFGSDPAANPSPGSVLDCVGDQFPRDDEIVETAATPHYVRPPGRLVHGFGVLAADLAAAQRAERVLSSRRFAECLGRSVAADLDVAETEAELLAIDVRDTARGHRVRFTGGTEDGVRPVQLDLVCVRDGRAVGLLWFADTPDPFPTAEVGAVVEAVLAR